MESSESHIISRSKKISKPRATFNDTKKRKFVKIVQQKLKNRQNLKERLECETNTISKKDLENQGPGNINQVLNKLDADIDETAISINHGDFSRDPFKAGCDLNLPDCTKSTPCFPLNQPHHLRKENFNSITTTSPQDGLEKIETDTSNQRDLENNLVGEIAGNQGEDLIEGITENQGEYVDNNLVGGIEGNQGENLIDYYQFDNEDSEALCLKFWSEVQNLAGVNFSQMDVDEQPKDGNYHPSLNYSLLYEFLQLQNGFLDDQNNLLLLQSFKNSNNSCRYDCFLPIVIYAIFNSGDDLKFEPKLTSKEIFALFALYNTYKDISSGKSLEDSRDKLWKFFYDLQIDNNACGETGIITDLFRVFNDVFDFHLTHDEEKLCTNCNHNEVVHGKKIGPLISIPNQYREGSFHQSYLNLFSEQSFSCPECTSDSYIITKTQINEPKYLVIIDDDFDDEASDYLALTPSFKNEITSKEYSLIASINIPSPGHYTTLLKDPYFHFKEQTQGYFYHDGLIYNGCIRPWQENDSIKPYIAIYKLLPDMNHNVLENLQKADLEPTDHSIQPSS